MKRNFSTGFIAAIMFVTVLGASALSVTHIKIISPDENRTAEVLNVGGTDRLATATTVTSVNVPNGRDPIPDMFFPFTAAGSIGDTVSITIAATDNDTTIPDDDLPAVSYEYTLVAGDAGDEHQLATNFAAALSADAGFQAAALEADVIAGDNRPIVHISSTEFSVTGEFHERPTVGDVAITTSGTTAVLLDSDNEKLISRAKETSLDRDPSNPHKLGIIGISGQVRIRGESVDKLFFGDAENGGSNDLNVNGSVTPVVFTIPANPTMGDNTIFLEQCKLFGNDTNIKSQDTNFMGLNSALNNGLLIEIFQNGSTTTLPLIKSTVDFLARFATTASDNKIINQSGGDFIQAVTDFIGKNVLVELVAGTADKVQITIQDNLTQIDNLILSCEGFEEEP